MILIIVWTSVLSLSMASAAFLIYRILDQRSVLVETTQTHAGMLANSVVRPLSLNDTAMAKKFLRELQWRDALDVAAVFDAEDRLFAQYRNPKLIRIPEVPKPGDEAYYFSGNYLIVFRPVHFHNERIGTIGIMTNLDSLNDGVRETVLVIILVMLFFVFVAFLLASHLQRHISEPITKLAEATRKVAEHKDYTVQVDTSTSDELGLLVGEFNNMLRKIRARDAALVEAKERLEKSSQELVSHRDHLEKLVEDRTSHLKSAYEEIRAFVFMFSHDLRTPLVNIKGFSGELRGNVDRALHLVSQTYESIPSDLDELLNEEIPEALTFIEGAASSMDRLINAMLKLSFLGRRDLKHEQLQTTEVIEEVLKRLDPVVQARKADIIPGPSMPIIIADRQSFDQILEHILKNALTYLDPKRPGKIKIWSEEGQDVHFFHIRDNGRGIEAGEIPKVFEPFRRVGTQGGQGQGMGMVYAKTLVNRHGGKIWCVSRPGEGTTFSFTISKNPDEFDGYAPLGT